MKKLITLSLLFVIGFSIIHEYVYAAYDDDHCSAIEYISEFDAPQTHGDICAIHFEYHQSYLLSQKVVLQHIDYKIIPNKTDKETYNFKTHLEFYKPPIS
ncbi:hypothetical protein M947_02135 [Sulfurimonas hongkongensis]|uniref:Uncharacterized protein n=1 Tax=Sulfurimonas hongkongensis TaxID=1172190 RepID=T0L433_9BACT|nr:hypothetical protein [Sulfurimonas hongkongensis]EQB40628.1 hypothetical protein M947_02135 [Sulfurimonas hongkongensis]